MDENRPVMLLIREIPERFLGLTKNAARTLVITGQIPSVRVGNKYLVCEQAIRDFLMKGNNHPAQPEPVQYGKIRQLV